MMHRNKRRSVTAGFTLLELMIAAVLLSMMVMAVSSLSVSGMDAQEFAKRLNRATEVNQDLMDQMRLELVTCVRLFGSDVEGDSNLALLDLAGVPQPLADVRMPKISPNEKIRQDTLMAEITGNSLFFTRLAWSDRFACTSGRDYLVDVYRWLYYYPTPEGAGPTPGSNIGLNFVRVASEPLVDAIGIDRITNATDRVEVLQHLFNATPDASGKRHSPCQVVWKRGELASVVGTLRQIESAGTLSDLPTAGRPSPWNILRSDTVVKGLLTYRHHSLATNYARASFGVGSYSVPMNTGSGFPHGFEVQIVGPSSARQAMIHLVLCSTVRRLQPAWSDMQMIVDVREY
ncbi:MAG TPA: type II secretion system protein [Planctomycetota bacterium]|nr:type II secretion system protein [Planctomycetota bacterium]